MRKEHDIQSAGKGKFDQFLNRKRHQQTEDQYMEAGMLIEEIETVDTGKAYSVLQHKINKHDKIRRLYTQFGKVAAILIIPLFIATIWSLSRSNLFTVDQLSYQEISGQQGMRSKVILPDGSQVWLNADSKLRYSVPFVRKNRELELIGEAFLDVVKNPESPMVVKFNHFNVKVLGTKFNVKAFPNDRQLEVVLKEGSIRLESDLKEAKNRTILLNPDQQWVYNKEKHTASVKKVNADKFIAWHKNVLILDNTPMAEVAKKLERWYGVKVKIMDSGLYKYKFTTVFENEPIHEVLNLLEMSSPIDIKYIAGKINQETGTTEKAIIQIKKMK